MYGKEIFNESCYLRSYLDQALSLSDEDAMESFITGKLKVDWGKIFKALRDGAIRIYKWIKAWTAIIIERIKGHEQVRVHLEAWSYCVSYITDHAQELNMTKPILGYAALIQENFRSWKTEYINREPDAIASIINRVEDFSKDLDGRVQIATNGLNGVRNILRADHGAGQYQAMNDTLMRSQTTLLTILNSYRTQEQTVLALIDTITAAYSTYTEKAKNENGVVEDIWGPVLQVIYAESDTASKLLTVIGTICSAVNMMMEECIFHNRKGSNSYLIPMQKNQYGILSQEVK